MRVKFNARDTQLLPMGTTTEEHAAASSSARWMCGASSEVPSQAAPYARMEHDAALGLVEEECDDSSDDEDVIAALAAAVSAKRRRSGE
jgi:hypothetical protein